jgi:hypothetical protein
MNESDEYCDECGGKCDGCHSLRKPSIDDQIEQIMKMITSQSSIVVKKVLERLQTLLETQ